MFFIIIVFNNNNKNIKIAPVRRRNYFLISFRVTETTHVRSSPDKTMIITNQGLSLWISNYNEAF